MVQVVYHTKTGHSKKLAQAVAVALGVEAVDTATWQARPGTPMLLLFSGIYAGKTAPQVLDFAHALRPLDAQKVVLFTTSASGQEQQEALRQALAQSGVKTAEKGFVCPGSFLFLRWGRPNQKDLADAVAFAKAL